MNYLTKIMIIGIVASSLTILIPIIGNVSHPNNLVFNGFFFPEDSHVYASMVYQSIGSNFPLAYNQGTTEYHRPSYLVGYFWIIGKIIEWSGLPLLVVFHAFQFLSILLFIISFGLVAIRIIEDELQSVFATLLVVFGAGLDWIFYLVQLIIPSVGGVLNGVLKYYNSPSTFGVLYNGHIYFGYSLFLFTFILLLNDQVKPTKKNTILSGLLMIVVFLTDVNITPPLFIFLFLFFIWINLQTFAWNKIIQSVTHWWPIWFAMLLYFLYVLWGLTNPIFVELFNNYLNFKRYTPVFYFPLIYGFLLLFVYWGWSNLRSTKNRFIGLLGLMFLLFFFFSQYPIKGQKYLFMLHIPVALIASFSLPYLIRKTNMSAKKIIFITFLLVSFSVPFIFMDKIADAKNPFFNTGNYLTQSEIESLDFLEKLPKANVLSPYYIGHNIIWRTNHHSYLGHWSLTNNYANKRKKAEEFYSAKMEEKEAYLFLSENNINYVVWGLPFEEENRGFFIVYPYTYKKIIYEKDGIIIYDTGIKNHWLK